MAISEAKPRKRSRYEYDEDLFRDTTMTFGEHLEELRICLFKAIAGLTVGVIVGLFFGGYVVRFIESPLEKALTEHYRIISREKLGQYADDLKKAGYNLTPEQLDALIEKTDYTFEQVYVNPYELLGLLKQAAPRQFADVRLDPPAAADGDGSEQLRRVFLWKPISEDLRIRPKSLNAHEAFMIYVKASLLVGALLASPWVFYHIWSFVAAGLYPHEKRYVHIFLPFSLGLFLVGAALAFFFVFEPVLGFLFKFNRSMGIDPDPRISEWLGFVLVLPLGFGVAFQLPLVMLFLERIGIFDVQAYLSKWRVSILVIAVLSMLLTPADPYSMLLMLIPLAILYFGGILLCKLMPRGRGLFADLDE